MAGEEGFELPESEKQEWYNQYMSEAATRKDIDEVIGILNQFMQQVSDEFIGVKAQLKEQDKKYDRLINTIDGFIGRIDKYETEQAARDRQFEKLLVWARKVSEKTGIPLDNL